MQTSKIMQNLRSFVMVKYNTKIQIYKVTDLFQTQCTMFSNTRLQTSPDMV